MCGTMTAFQRRRSQSNCVPEKHHNKILLRCFDLALKIANDNVQRGIITGYNIGLNMGELQDKLACIPMYIPFQGKMEIVKTLTGGVRNVIPGKGNYKKMHSGPNHNNKHR